AGVGSCLNRYGVRDDVSLRETRLRPHEACEASDAVFEPLVTRREAPADEAFAFGSERAAGREAELRLGDEPAAERHAVVDAFDAKECIHRAGRRRDVDARQRAQAVDEAVARA